MMIASFEHGSFSELFPVSGFKSSRNVFLKIYRS